MARPERHPAPAPVLLRRHRPGPHGGGDYSWGGLPDNGVSLLKPNAGQMVSPFGGDGGDVIIDTNFGGTWHAVTSGVLPNRMPTSFTIDPANSAHAVVTYGGFSRHWIPNAGEGARRPWTGVA